MARQAKNGTSPRDLPFKTVEGPDGTKVRVKVVLADSKTLASDLLAAFRSNVRRVREEQRQPNGSTDTPQA
jgi:hypothetical protein